MKVALVFFGQPRFVQSRLALLSHKWHLRKQNYDVFGHFWFEELAKYNFSAWTTLKANQSIVPNDAPEIIKKEFPEATFATSIPEVFKPPIEFEALIRSWEIDPETKNEFLRLNSDSTKMYSNTTSQLFSVHLALKTLEKVESDYDLIVLSRWDNLIWEFPNLEKLDRTKLTVADTHDFGIPDLLLIGPPSLIRATDAYLGLPDLFLKVPSMSAEKVKAAYFLSKYEKGDISRTKISITILRSSNLMWLARSFFHSSGVARCIYESTPVFVRKLFLHYRKQGLMSGTKLGKREEI
jgi:hypothetical protein